MRMSLNNAGSSPRHLAPVADSCVFSDSWVLYVPLPISSHKAGVILIWENIERKNLVNQTSGEENEERIYSKS
jgi:hypothetical protein